MLMEMGTPFSPSLFRYKGKLENGNREKEAKLPNESLLIVDDVEILSFFSLLAFGCWR